MKRIWLSLSVLAIAPMTLMNAQPSDNAGGPCVASYLKDLEELGYCVIPRVISTAETERLYQRVWHEFIEKAWPLCRMDDRSNWKEAFPMHNKLGIFAGPSGQIQAMWDVRQDPRVVEIFANVWNTKELIVSMDGMSIMCPPEIREGYFEPWPHVDQSVAKTEQNTSSYSGTSSDFVSESLLKTKPYTVQGQFLFEDSCDGDGGFYCIPKSHLWFNEFAPQLEAIMAMDVPRDQKRAARTKFLQDFFENIKDGSGNLYCLKHVTAPRGSVILWDSRTVHWNQHPRKDRQCSNNPRVRMVGYICYVPKSRLTDEARVLRKQAFETGVSTTHDPVHPVLRTSVESLPPEYAQFVEDPSYTQPKIQLTPLGESLLGF